MLVSALLIRATLAAFDTRFTSAHSALPTAWTPQRTGSGRASAGPAPARRRPDKRPSQRMRFRTFFAAVSAAFAVLWAAFFPAAAALSTVFLVVSAAFFTAGLAFS